MEFKKKLLISLGITFLVIAGLGMGIGVMGSQITGHVQSVRAIRNETVEQIEAVTMISALRKELETVTPLKSRLEAIIPKRDQLLSFRNDIQTKGVAQGINAAVTIAGTSVVNNLGKTDFSITAEGSAERIIEFMKSLERGTYFIKVTSFDLTTQGMMSRATISGQVFSR